MQDSFLYNLIELVQWFYLFYFIGLNSTYGILGLISLFVLPRYIQKQSAQRLPHSETGFEPPISLIVTAYNEAPVIIPATEALRQLDYREFEIVIVNDGSTDNMMDLLKKKYDLEVFPAAIRESIDHQPIKAVYQSKIHSNIRVVDKENGGCKADASNAGINAAKYGLFMPLDADTILERDCLKLLIQPYLLNAETIAVGGSVRILNGCEVENGFLTKVSFPKNWYARFQVLEYGRAFLNGRVGWNFFDALPLISGAFGLFKKEAVVEVGGYSNTSLGEDMDLVLRLHRHFRLKDIPYRVDFVSDATCWTEVPYGYDILKKQRVRWQRGLFDCIWENRKLLFHPRSGGVGWGSMPFLLFMEGLSPFIELFGYFFFVIAYYLGLVSLEGTLAFFFLSFISGFVISMSTVLLEELIFQTYPEKKDLYTMIACAFIENFGYTQINSVWRLEGTLKWILNTKKSWGMMARSAEWNKSATEEEGGLHSVFEKEKETAG